MERYKAIILIGPPGSGKGTQAKLLPSDRFIHISTGEMCRSANTKTKIGKQIKEFIDSGNFIPDNIMVSLLKNNLDELEKSKKYNPEKHTLILDGIPRNKSQIEMIKGFIDIEKIVSLKISDEEIKKRLLNRSKIEGRKDDSNEAIITHRIEVFKTQTLEAINSFDNFFELESDGMAEEVNKRLLNLLEKSSN